MATPSALQTALTATSILRLAGEVYFKRGVDYCRRDLVDRLEQTGDALTATVLGTEDYEIRLSAKNNNLKHFCSCPLGEDGQFCKHLVAAALTWLARKAVSSNSDDGLRATLLAQEKEALVDLMLEWSKKDQSLRDRLADIGRVEEALLPSVEEVGRRLKDVMRVNGYVRAPVYAGRVHTALDDLETLLERGLAAAAIPLCESTITSLAKVADRVDDSDGQMMELMERTGEIHLRACELAPPDPERLGARLFALELSSQYGEWRGAVQTYAHILGEPGIAAFRREADAMWQGVPFRTTQEVKGYDSRYDGITRIMELLARESGDVEQWIAIFERDLTASSRYLKIAAAYLDAGQHEKALHWAERGMTAYPASEDAGLRRLAAELYRHAERYADAVRLAWSDFRYAPDLVSYRRLEEFARAADDWENVDGWRDRAIAYVRRAATEDHSKAIRQGAVSAWSYGSIRSLLTEIFLDEGRAEQAWEEAQSIDPSEALWLRLAAVRGKTHPEDAVPIYLKLAEKAIFFCSNNRYDIALELYEKAAALMQALGKSREFEEHFAGVRLRNKAKRNFQKLAEERRQFLYLSGSMLSE